MSKLRKRLGFLAVFVLAATVLVAFPAAADTTPGTFGHVDQGHVDSSATVGTSGGGTGSGDEAPHIECKWELVDIERPGFGDASNGMQYNYWDGTRWWSDDDPWTHPHTGESEFPYPCSWTQTSGGAFYFEGSQHNIQVLANVEDDPTERLIELWAAVDGPNSQIQNIGQVWWKVFHPDGTLKAQPHDDEGIPNSECMTLGAGYPNPVNDPENFVIVKSVESMFFAAHNTGQASFAAIKSMVDRCNERVKRFYHGQFKLSKHQPCGEYKVEVSAVAANTGATDTLVNFFDVYCFINLELDFTSVDWGTISSNAHAVVDGDTIFLQDDGFPTAKNTGSGGLNLSVVFNALVKDGDPTKAIRKFDVAFGRSSAVLVGDPEIATPTNATQSDPTDDKSEEVFFGSAPAQTLCANETGKLDFSVLATNAAAGTYTGKIWLFAYPDGTSPQGASPDNGGVNGIKQFGATPPGTEHNTCLNDQGIWGGLHDDGADGQPDGIDLTNGMPANDDGYGSNQRTVDPNGVICDMPPTSYPGNANPLCPAVGP